MLYFKQEKDYTCACACFRMCLSQFEENIPDENTLELEMGTNDKIGTHPHSVVQAAWNRGYQAISAENGDFQTLQDLKDEGYAVMLMVSVDVPHFTVLDEINPTHIFFKDPYFGPRIAKERKKFISDKQTYPHYRWKVLSEEFKKYLPEYDFSSVQSICGWIAIKK